ncbi:MAG TPA: hypothetical protein VJK47_04540, partial [Dehalococcoidales bacterium]|nr:hypothetical protein [Dehalococcoidales bacterium]
MAIQAKAKTSQDREKRLIDQIEKKHGKSVAELREERDKRIRDAIELKVPDRVPVTFNFGSFAARYAGLPNSVMYYDPVAYGEAVIKALVDIEPDSGGAAVGTNSGLMLEILDVKHQRWPGGNLPPDGTYQFVEGEYMQADEYDLFLNDPSDFVLRYYLPRLYGTISPASKLPPFRTMIGGTSFTGLLAFWTRPEFKELGEKMTKAAEEQAKWAKIGAEYSAQ